MPQVFVIECELGRTHDSHKFTFEGTTDTMATLPDSAFSVCVHLDEERVSWKGHHLLCVLRYNSHDTELSRQILFRCVVSRLLTLTLNVEYRVNFLVSKRIGLELTSPEINLPIVGSLTPEQVQQRLRQQIERIQHWIVEQEREKLEVSTTNQREGQQVLTNQWQIEQQDRVRNRILQEEIVE